MGGDYAFKMSNYIVMLMGEIDYAWGSNYSSKS